MANGDDETVVRVEDWQPHAIHIKFHNEFRSSAGYRDANPHTQAFIDLHVQAHEKLLLDQHNQELAQQAQMQQAQQQAQLQMQAQQMHLEQQMQPKQDNTNKGKAA